MGVNQREFGASSKKTKDGSCIERFAAGTKCGKNSADQSKIFLGVQCPAVGRQIHFMDELFEHEQFRVKVNKRRYVLALVSARRLLVCRTQGRVCEYFGVEALGKVR